ncbi:hypothetical protein DQW77_14000 [Roseovarius sp. TE539]|uniref:hypothetical protein n=1 Tax=Roseovarius sp. TE539 TaxID=2249812 RepID=UPI000E0672D7|nr:hypothetical protein [Roseovarius sp. TE539]RBI70557.1 hypothetical protein DQW77_14000 [Roseovarius sp. TE539]
MGDGGNTITLTLTWQVFGTAMTVLAVVVLSAFVLLATGKGRLDLGRERMGLEGLPHFVVLILTVIWAALLLTLLWGVFWVIFGIMDRTAAPTQAEGLDLRWSLLTLTALTAALGAVISLPFTLIRMALNRRQTETAEQGHINDRINTAVQGLGAEKEVNRLGRQVTLLFKEAEAVSIEFEWKDEPLQLPPGATRGKNEKWENIAVTIPNLEVRIGAIYALERITQDSDRDHVQIMEILCAYIRENAKTSDLTPKELPFERGSLRVDLQAAIDVIGRRYESQKSVERAKRYRLDLRGTDLSFANFARGDFSAAILASCRLGGVCI